MKKGTITPLFELKVEIDRVMKLKGIKIALKGFDKLGLEKIKSIKIYNKIVYKLSKDEAKKYGVDDDFMLIFVNWNKKEYEIYLKDVSIVDEEALKVIKNYNKEE